MLRATKIVTSAITTACFLVVADFSLIEKEAHAALMSFRDQENFLSAVKDVSFESFEDQPSDGSGIYQGRDIVETADFSVIRGEGSLLSLNFACVDFGPCPTDGRKFIDASLQVNLKFKQPINTFGLTLAGQQFFDEGQVIDDIPLVISLDTGESITVVDRLVELGIGDASSKGIFFGFVSDVPFSEVRFDAKGRDNFQGSYGLDGIYYGLDASKQTVPEADSVTSLFSVLVMGLLLRGLLKQGRGSEMLLR